MQNFRNLTSKLLSFKLIINMSFKNSLSHKLRLVFLIYGISIWLVTTINLPKGQKTLSYSYAHGFKIFDSENFNSNQY